jgi:hypothetical protein
MVQPKPARSDEDLDRRPAAAHRVNQLWSVHASGHVDIREQHGDIRASLQQGNGFVRIASFQRYESRILDEFDGRLAQKPQLAQIGLDLRCSSIRVPAASGSFQDPLARSERVWRADIESQG